MGVKVEKEEVTEEKTEEKKEEAKEKKEETKEELKEAKEKAAEIKEALNEAQIAGASESSVHALIEQLRDFNEKISNLESKLKHKSKWFPF